MANTISKDYEVTRRTFMTAEGEVKMGQGVTARSLVRMLKESADGEAVVMFAVMLPNGQSVFSGVQGMIPDYDGTGACCVLLDMNIANAISRG